jgi:hypothetical protein
VRDRVRVVAAVGAELVDVAVGEDGRRARVQACDGGRLGGRRGRRVWRGRFGRGRSGLCDERRARQRIDRPGSAVGSASSRGEEWITVDFRDWCAGGKYSGI